MNSRSYKSWQIFRRLGGRREGRPIMLKEESLFYKLTTIANLAATLGLGILALSFSRSYNERELRRDIEKQNYEMRKDKAASKRSCIEFDIELARGVAVADNEPLRIAMTRSIEDHVVQCHRIGYEVDRRVALALLDRVGHRAPPSVAREVNEARSSIRNVERGGPVTDRQRAEAYDLLGEDGEVGDLVDIAAYGGGAVLAGTGLLNFKKHVDNPSENELRQAIGPGVVGKGTLEVPQD